MKIVYECKECGNVIIRPIKENEEILSGKVLCDKCSNFIMFFKVINE